MRRTRPTAVDLYNGSGGVTAGLKRAGFRVVAAVDNDPVACKTYRANHPTTRLYEGDIRSVNPERIRCMDLRGQDADLLVVCAPCQPFSSQNRKRGDDPRTSLILQAARFAAALRPRLIFFENVPGLAKNRNQWVLVALRKSLAVIGYRLSDPMEVDAADYGVPQRRNRCVMFAAPGKRLPRLPMPITPEGKRVTVADAIAGLPSLAAGEVDLSDSLHRARHHQPIALARLKKISKNGGSRDQLPSELVLPCHVGYRGHPDVYGRMRWDDVAPTLTTGCTDVTKGRFAHPEDDRAITPREAALLQTFPSNYVFHGNLSQIETQIGNAVPVKLIEAFGLTFAQAVRGRG